MLIKIGNLATKNALLAEMSSSYDNLEEFFQDYIDKLNFPRFFGMNWNAFYDCLCDLSWISEEIIVIFHPRLQDLRPDDRAVFNNVMNDARKSWNTEPSKLIVYVLGEDLDLKR